MALTRFSGDAEVISQLSNQPNDNDGLSAAQLKAKFDQYGANFKEYFNNVFIPEVESAINAAAAGIGSAGFSGAIITDNTVSAEKLLHTAGIEAVNTPAIRDSAVNEQKLANGSVSYEKLTSALKAILDGKQAQLTFDDAPTENSNNPVKSGGIKSALDNKQNNLTFDTTPTEGNYAPHVVSSGVVYSQLALKQAKHIARSANVAANSWSASNTVNVTIQDVTASNTIIVTPAPASFLDWSNCGIRCTAQASNQITLTARSKPSAQITVQVLIFN